MDQGTIPDSRLAAAMEEAARPSLSVPVPRCFNPGPLLELVECGPQTWQPGCEGEALRYLADLLDVIAAPEARRAYSS